MTTAVSNLPHPRSLFVTVVAWIFIVLSAFMIIGSACFGLMTILMESLAESEPGMTAWLGVLQSFVVMVLVIAAAILALSIGLLRRSRWARGAFIRMLAASIAFQMLLPIVGVAWFLSMTPEPPDQAKLLVYGFLALWCAIGLAIGLFWSVIDIWLIRRLSAPDVGAEFQPVPG
ncbi:MAG: hypothetical protein RLY21_971 [Planctomycetota bacterium]|jgi:hypothetical protein